MGFFILVIIMSNRNLYGLFLESAGITTDSRNVKPGNIFFALSGENFDGNRFARQALENGCLYAVIDNREYYIPGKTLLVDNVLTALQELAAFHRKNFNIPVVAITGSNGKTTTKELMRDVLSSGYCVLATRGNLNNHIGVPLTLLELNDKHEVAVIEMGANHRGEIDLLCRIAEPTHGLITNAGTAHLEGFGSPEGVLKAKSELFDYLKETGGTIMLNYDQPNLREVVTGLKYKYIAFGSAENQFVYGKLNESAGYLNLSVMINYPEGKGNVPERSVDLNTKITGSYNYENILAAVCTGALFGIPAGDIKEAVEQYIPANNRSQIAETPDNMLLLDAYNANPDSMKAAILHFTSMPGDNKSVILGDMLELGDYAKNEHQKIVELIANKGFREVLLVGNIFCSVSRPGSFIAFEKTEQLIEWLTGNPLRNRFILLKGSRGIGLERSISVL